MPVGTERAGRALGRWVSCRVATSGRAIKTTRLCSSQAKRRHYNQEDELPDRTREAQRNLSANDFLARAMANTLRPFLPSPTKWFDNAEEARVHVSVFRVYRVPYSLDKTYVRLAEFGQVRAVFVNADFPYPEFSFEMAPTPEGSTQPDGRLVGWLTTDPGNLLLLMTPVTSDRQNVNPEAAAILRIDTARAFIVGTMGLNAAFERVCEFSVNYRDTTKLSISHTSRTLENPMSYKVPNIHDGPTLELIKSVVEGIDAAQPV